MSPARQRFFEAADISPGSILFFLTFFDWIEIALIVLPVFALIVQAMDFGDHDAKVEVTYWFAILLAVNPAVPADIKIQPIYKGIIPFVLLQLTGLGLGLGLVIAFPDLALWRPRVLQN